MAIPKFYTIKEVAEMMKLHENLVRKLIYSQQLRAVLFGTAYRISEEDIDKYIKTHAAHPYHVFPTRGR